ncbi:hypothetical protein G9G53_22740 [Paenibacillus sp. EKM206P]|uniref:hypothetical protein n=1 Tax=Paenibacillus sp. EKM206P TaxID=1683674 RepID=UPI0013E9FDC2|nr:hypothetical protein [Paenibacillus sp. EKM206P]KAF6569109.1 hypothetical protein G9G53_22740 [Paenibacillus sp. EKM206P]
MRILRKLLDNLGDKWNKLPKEVQFLTLGRGSGLHSMVTVDEGVIYFHSAPYRMELPDKQFVNLQGLDAAGLIGAIHDLGYIADLTPGTIRQDAVPLALIEVTNIPLDSTLNAFTSNVWRRIYPVYRALRKAEADTDLALLQLDRNMATGRWLDYWGSFFGLQRRPAELSESFRRRFTMWVLNPKTNNVALQELLAYQLGESGGVEVYDKAPAVLGVRLDAKYTESGEVLSAFRSILLENRGGGIAFTTSVHVYTPIQHTHSYRSRLRLRSGVHFFGGRPWYLDGLEVLNGSATLSGWTGGRRRYVNRMEFKNKHRIENEQTGVVKARKNYWLLDGSVMLDGSRTLSSTEIITEV